MRRLSLFAAMLMASVAPAQADPISGTIAAVGAWYASVGVVGQLLVQVGVGLALSVASYGLQYLISGGSRRAEQAQAQAETGGVTLPEIDGLLEVVRAYGTTVTPGGVFFKKTYAGSGSSTPNHYVLGLALSEGICDGIDALIINGIECVFDGSNVPQTYPWNNGAGSTYLEISFRSGTEDQAIDPIIDAHFDEDAEFRQRGVCTLVLDMQFGLSVAHHTELWGTTGIPTLLVRLRGLRCYDRTNPLQNPDDATTWTYSENATVCIEDYLVAEMGGQVDRDDIDHDLAAESIAIDDEWVATLDGLERRGRVNGLVFSGEANVDVLAAMAQQNRAIISKAQGKYVIRSDRPADPVATIYQGQWRGQVSYRNERETRSAVDGVVAQFYPASRFNQAAETSYPAAAMDDVDASRVTLKFTDSPATAQRLSFGMVKDNQAGKSISGLFDTSVLVAPGKANRMLQVGDVVRFEVSSPYDALGGLYQVDGIEINANFSVSLAMSEAPADAITGWSTALETAFADEPA